MNIMNRVTMRSLLKNRTRTLVTVIGIALSAALICAVTTYISSFYNTLTENAKYEKGDWHIAYYYRHFSDYEQLAANDKIAGIEYVQELGYAKGENEYSYNYVIGTNGNFEEKNLAIHPYEGRYPASSDEIMLALFESENYAIGDKITLEIGDRYYNGKPVPNFYDELEDNEQRSTFTKGEELRIRETRTYTVVGFYYPMSVLDAAALSSHVGLGYPAVTIADGEMSDSFAYDFFVKLKNPADANSFFTDSDFVSLNETLLTYMGFSPFAVQNLTIWGVAVLLVGIIAFACILLIGNSFSISVSERTKQFGLLFSLGATGKQIRRSVLFECLVVSIAGIPVGAALGIGAVAVSLQFMDSVVSAIGLKVPLTLSVNIFALLIGIAVSLLTVLISAWIPAKRASRITAIEAIRQTKDIKNTPVKVSKLTEKLLGISGVLAAKYYKRSKKHYKSSVIGLSLSLFLFISIYAFGEYFNIMISATSDVYKYDVSADYIDQILGEDLTAEALLKEYKAADHVTDAAMTVYGDPVSYEDDPGGYSVSVVAGINKSCVTAQAIERGSVNAPEDISRYSDEETSAIYSEAPSDFDSTDYLYLDANIVFVDDEAFKSLLKQYGLNEAEYTAPKNPLAVAVDGKRSYDIHSGKNRKTNVLNSDKAQLYIYRYEVPSGMYSIADKYDKNGDEYVTFTDYDLYFDEHKQSEDAYEIKAERIALNIGKVIYDAPFYVTVNFAKLNLIYPKSVMGNICEKWSDKSFTTCYITSDDHTATSRAIEDINNKYTLGTDIYVRTEDYHAEMQSSLGIIDTVRAAVIIFVGIISVIAVTNVFNTVSTNINLRRREFAMLRSVGMTNGEFNRMMIYECIIYWLKSILYGIPPTFLITVVTYFIMYQTIEFDFTFPWETAAAAVAVMCILMLLTVFYAMSKVKKANPIDELKNENI